MLKPHTQLRIGIIALAIAAVLLGWLAASPGQTTPPAHSAVLTWGPSPSAVSNPGIVYNVYRASGICSGSSTFSMLKAGVTGLTYTDSTITTGAWCYELTAALGGVESKPSNQVTAALLVAPPTTVTVTIN
jgi:hypothetical protein